METTGQTSIVFLRPGRGEAGHADGERATGETLPRGPGRRLEGLFSIVLDLRIGVEGIAVDGLAFKIGFFRVVGDPGNGGSRESEPRDFRDI